MFSRKRMDVFECLDSLQMSHIQVTIDVYYDLVVLLDDFLSRLLQIVHKVELGNIILDEV